MQIEHDSSNNDITPSDEAHYQRKRQLANCENDFFPSPLLWLLNVLLSPARRSSPYIYFREFVRCFEFQMISNEKIK